MKNLQVELPDGLTSELDAAVQVGWFQNPREVARLALVHFLREKRLGLIEQFQHEDVIGAVQQRDSAP